MKGNPNQGRETVIPGVDEGKSSPNRRLDRITSGKAWRNWEGLQDGVTQVVAVFPMLQPGRLQALPESHSESEGRTAYLLPWDSDRVCSSRTKGLVELGRVYALTLVYACIAPHGAEVIPQLAKGGDRARFRKTTNGMRSLAKRVKSYRPDTIVVASPHNLRLVMKIAVVEAENSSGRLSTSPGNSVTLTAKCDVQFARALLNHATQKGLPVAGANYGTSEGPASDMPMDWGTFVPLWFFLREKSPRSKVVIVTPSRDIPLEQNVKFGAVIAELAEKHRGKRIVFVASADQAHAHSKSGPYGYNKAAREYDLKIVGAIKANALGSILGLNPRLVDQAKPDSLWQMAILAGILRRVSMQAKLVSYDVPTYYGMVCAGFERVRNSS